ncbi:MULTISPECIES: hypothetical protein [Streptomyces]|uniref:Uncharacterized protein n=2 Tax=Streptomyces TaxID=1883 RepID=A0ABV9ITM9_9ACTN
MLRGYALTADRREHALLAVCARAPRAVMCGESALALHELIDDIPYPLATVIAE